MSGKTAPQFVLGVDGGGTKTEFVLAEISGAEFLRRRVGCSNYECLPGGLSELQSLLSQEIASLLKEAGAGPQQLLFAVLGLAGADTAWQHRLLERTVRAAGLQRFMVCNDAYLALKAGSAEGVGIAAVNGTGCSVAGIDPAGKRIQIGGMGELTWDCGGGDYLAQCACAAVYGQLFKRGPFTGMTQLLAQTAAEPDPAQLFERLTQLLRSGKLRLRDLNRIVFGAANVEDPVALRILSHMGRENGCSILAAVDALAFDEYIPVVLAGSIYRYGENQTAVNMLQKTVREGSPEHVFSFQVLKRPPVAGAVLWAAEHILSSKEFSLFKTGVIHALD